MGPPTKEATCSEGVPSTAHAPRVRLLAIFQNTARGTSRKGQSRRCENPERLRQPKSGKRFSTECSQVRLVYGFREITPAKRRARGRSRHGRRSPDSGGKRMRALRSSSKYCGRRLLYRIPGHRASCPSHWLRRLVARTPNSRTCSNFSGPQRRSRHAGGLAWFSLGIACCTW
jgi:hypothetical protein